MKIRSKPDLRLRLKPEPLTMRCIYLGESSDGSGAIVYIFEKQRFTCASYGDLYFTENVRPRLDRIIGKYDFRGVENSLPSDAQQADDAGGTVIPELDDVAPLPRAPEHELDRRLRAGAPEPVDDEPQRHLEHGDDRGWRPGHCREPKCEYDIGHSGPHSYERLRIEYTPCDITVALTCTYRYVAARS